jgi:hypothetical protein
MPLWSSLGNDEKNAELRKVIERAAWDEPFYKDCLDPQKVRDAIKDKTGLIFDAYVKEVKCFKDESETEEKVLVLLAPCIPQPTAPPNPPPADKYYWMCTYPTYVPK